MSNMMKDTCLPIRNGLLPLQGVNYKCDDTITQGVALGYEHVGLSGRRSHTMIIILGGV